MWPRYVLNPTCVTSGCRLRQFPQTKHWTDNCVIKKNWKSAGGRGAYLILKKNHTNRAALVVVNKLSRLWPESGPVSEEDGEGTKQSPNPTKGLLFILLWLSKGGEYKATCGQIHYILDSFKQKRDYYKASRCCCAWSAVVHGLSGE